MSSEEALAVASPLKTIENTMGKTSAGTPVGPAKASPTTRVTRTPRGASTSAESFSPTTRSPASPSWRTPVASSASPAQKSPATLTPKSATSSQQRQGARTDKVARPRSGRPHSSSSASPTIRRSKSGDVKSRGNSPSSSPANSVKLRTGKPPAKAAPASLDKPAKEAKEEKAESDTSEKRTVEKMFPAEKKLTPPEGDESSSSRSPSPVQKKPRSSTSGGGGNQRKKAAVKVPEMDAENKSLSQLNSNINNLFLEQLRALLASLKLDDRGIKEVLRKRVKNHYRSAAVARGDLKLAAPEIALDYYCVMDVEATCEQEVLDGYVHEPIELPVAIVNSRTKTVEFRFHAYCRPILQPKLSAFCTQLTGIKQETVDAAEPFDVVLSELVSWLERSLAGKSFAFVTDGDADIRRFLAPACQRLGLEVPVFWRSWINIRNSLANFYRLNMARMDLPTGAEKSTPPVQRGKIAGMLHTLGLPLCGRAHNGRDDTENVARLLQVMLRDSCCPRVNKSLESRSGESMASPASSAGGASSSPTSDGGTVSSEEPSPLALAQDCPSPTLDSVQDLAVTETAAPARAGTPEALAVSPGPRGRGEAEVRTVAVGSGGDHGSSSTTSSAEARHVVVVPAVTPSGGSVAAEGSSPDGGVSPNGKFESESPLVEVNVPASTDSDCVSTSPDDEAAGERQSEMSVESESPCLTLSTTESDAQHLSCAQADSGIEDLSPASEGSCSPCSPAVEQTPANTNAMATADSADAPPPAEDRSEGVVCESPVPAADPATPAAAQSKTAAAQADLEEGEIVSDSDDSSGDAERTVTEDSSLRDVESEEKEGFGAAPETRILTINDKKVVETSL